MKILITPFNWFPNSAGGGEWYLYRLTKHLIRLGHEVKCICYCEFPFIFDGIECFPQGDMQTLFMNNNDLFDWCDIVIGQLIGNPLQYNKCRQHNKPNIFIAHNFAKHYFITDRTSVVYNSHYMASLNLFDAPSTVLQPLVDYMDYKPSTGNKIALINCNENKGGSLFAELAERMPDREFVGYEGMYGTQVKSPAVTYYPNGVINWDDIGLLLVPSLTESWSQVATEAICCGVPVICSDLPGLRENLSICGTYIKERDDICGWMFAINRLMSDSEYYNEVRKSSLYRARMLDPIPRMAAFNEWLCNLV